MSNRHRIGWLSLIVILAMMLASCGGAATSPPAEPTTVPVEPTEAPPEPTEAPPEPTQTEEPGVIKIGLPAGFTGPVPVPSENMKIGAEIAIDEINSRGGLNIGGNRYLLELVTADDKCAPEEAIAALEYLLTVEKVDFLVGGLCSSAVLGSMDIAQREGVVYIDVAAASSKINQTIAENEYKYLFQFSPTTLDNVLTVAEASITLLEPMTLAMLGEDTDAGRDAETFLTEWLAENAPNVEILSVDFVPLTAGTMLPEVNKIKSLDPDILYLTFTGVNSESFADQAMEVGLNTTMIVDGWGNDFGRPEFIQEHPEISEYMIVNIRWSPKYKTSLSDAFVSEFEARTGRDAHFFAVEQYDAMLVLADALERAGTLDSDAVVAALENGEVEGVWGTHSFSSLEEGHRTRWQMVIAQIVDGEYHIVWPEEGAERDVVLPDWYQPGE